MENPRKHDKKNTTKTLSLKIVAGAGAGRFGVGGAVLFGGVLVTATVVSALAFRRRSQRRSSSSENIKNTTSPNTTSPAPAPVTDAPRKLELMMKSDQDFSAESLSLEVQNLSDEVISMKEIKSEDIQSLTPDEEMIDLFVGEDQESTLIRVDSAFESEEFDSNCEKIDLHSEERVVMAAKIKEDSCLERDDGDGSEEQAHLMLIDDENIEHDYANSLVFDKGVISIEEYDVKDIVSEALENEDKEDGDHQETVFVNETAALKIDCVNQVEVEDNLQVQVLEEIETGYADQIDNEVDAASLLELEITGEEEVIKAACVNLINKEDVFKTSDHNMHQVYETFVVECVMNTLKEAVDDQTTGKEDAPSKNKETAQVVEEQATKEDEMMITEYELINKDEIPHVQSVKDDENSKEDVIKEVIKMADHEVAPEKLMAAGVMNRIKEAVNDQTAAKEDAPPSQLMNIKERDKETAQKVEEQATVEDELFNGDEKHNVDELTEAAKGDDQTEYELVKKDETQYVQSVKECMHEELTAEEKISNHKTEESIEENENVTVLRESQNDSNGNGNIKEDEGSKSTSTEEEKHPFAAGYPWDLRLMAWSVLISVWCICHWYSELPFPELSFVGSLFFIMIILGYRNRARSLVKYECK